MYLYNLLFVLDYLFSLKPDNSFLCLIIYFLCRLKINHDSHEFILEFGTVGNTDDDDDEVRTSVLQRILPKDSVALPSY
jgi:hypothetical protein